MQDIQLVEICGKANQHCCWSQKQHSCILISVAIQKGSLNDFVAALELAAEQHMYGAEYVRGILSAPSEISHEQPAHQVALQLRELAPTQAPVERDLAQYEQYVANREQLACTPEGR